MAKALEDTAFYRFPRLLALNEVGGEPDAHGLAPEAFHALNAERLRNWPGSMLGTATHDTKRGEDARARLAVLSELPGEWAEAARSWRGLNGAVRPAGLHPKDEYTLYQALVGAWPAELRPDDAEGLGVLAERVRATSPRPCARARSARPGSTRTRATRRRRWASPRTLLDPARSGRSWRR
jgi:(1->4)-alpha-D-glucan 1-alpha-D-glucosylmutase